jgi:hypothetical protein
VVDNYLIAWLGVAWSLGVGCALILWVKARNAAAARAGSLAAYRRQEKLIAFLEGRIEQQQEQLAAAKQNALYWEKLARDYEEEVMKIAGKG